MTDPARVVVVTADELRQLVREAVRAELAARPNVDDDWIDQRTVARMLCVKPATIPGYVKREGLPAHRGGRFYTFRRSEVIAWMEARPLRPRSHARRHGATVRLLRGGKPGGTGA